MFRCLLKRLCASVDAADGQNEWRSELIRHEQSLRDDKSAVARGAVVDERCRAMPRYARVRLFAA